MALEINLAGKKALISGVSSGIGAGIARRLAQAGCDVAGCGLAEPSDPGALAFCREVKAAGRRAVYQCCDLTDPAAPAIWVNRAAADLGGVDILVSNAGRNVFVGASKCDDATWQECMDLNLAAHWRLARAAHPFLVRSAHPIIMVITSNHAHQTIPGCFPYNVAKAGLLALVQSLAIEWGPKVRTVGIAPGFIDTPGNKTWFESFPDPAAERARTEQSHPVGHLGTVEEIGSLCAFLASEHATFISGTTLLVDGGVSARLQESAEAGNREVLVAHGGSTTATPLKKPEAINHKNSAACLAR